MKKIKTIIIDDEKPARRLIENYCARVDFIEVIGSFKSPLNALSYIENNLVDLLFLDIRMPEISGIDFLKTLHQKPSIILTTAYREHAADAFELDVLDYLLKPIEFPRFLKSINKLQKRTILFDKKTELTDEESFNIKANKRSYKISYTDLLFIQSNSEYIEYFTKTHGKLMVYGSLKGIENELPSSFIRIHRSYIINYDEIDYVEGNRIVIRDHVLAISESYKNLFFKKWSN